MPRLNVIGSSCAGKSTYASRLAKGLCIPHVELDSLNFEADWIEVSADVFRQRIVDAVAGDSWVVDGNYRVAREMIWPIADTVIWLDYSLARVLWRSIRRSAIRIIRREPCCNGNRESVRRLLSRQSIVLWIWKTHRSRRENFHRLLPTLAGKNTSVIVLKTPRQAELWLRNYLNNPARLSHTNFNIPEPI